MTTPTFSALTDKEQGWIRNQLDSVSLFIDAYSPDDSGQPITLPILDRAFALWLAQDIRENAQVNAAINLVGIRFGQFLVDVAGFRWVIATDRNNSDLAVLALPGRGDVLVYPANFVAKRWERRETSFLARAFAAIREQTEAVAAAGSGEARRPWWRFW
jgi:hypothetical protein